MRLKLCLAVLRRVVVIYKRQPQILKVQFHCRCVSLACRVKVELGRPQTGPCLDWGTKSRAARPQDMRSVRPGSTLLILPGEKG